MNRRLGIVDLNPTFPETRFADESASLEVEARQLDDAGSPSTHESPFGGFLEHYYDLERDRT